MQEFIYIKGQRWQRYHIRDKKGSAQMLANELRKKGYLARVIKDPKTKEYGVYGRRKKGLSY